MPPPGQPTEPEVLGEVRSGSSAAFGLLFERHHEAVYNFCFRRTASWSSADDLTSVVFLEAWRNRDRMELHHDSVLPWLYGIATNVCRNQRRSSARHRQALARLPRPAATPDPSDDIAARVDDERRMREVLHVISSLPKDQRDIVALVAWEGLDYAAAAAALGIPIGTVRSRLARARRRLSTSSATPQLEELS